MNFGIGLKIRTNITIVHINLYTSRFRHKLKRDRERLLFIHIMVAVHSDALSTTISWGPDKN